MLLFVGVAFVALHTAMAVPPAFPGKTLSVAVDARTLSADDQEKILQWEDVSSMYRVPFTAAASEAPSFRDNQAFCWPGLYFDGTDRMMLQTVDNGAQITNLNNQGLGLDVFVAAQPNADSSAQLQFLIARVLDRTNTEYSGDGWALGTEMRNGLHAVSARAATFTGGGKTVGTHPAAASLTVTNETMGRGIFHMSIAPTEFVNESSLVSVAHGAAPIESSSPPLIWGGLGANVEVNNSLAHMTEDTDNSEVYLAGLHSDAFRGTLYEVAIYTGGLSASERKSVQQYLANKWYATCPRPRNLLANGTDSRYFFTGDGCVPTTQAGVINDGEQCTMRCVGGSSAVVANWPHHTCHNGKWDGGLPVCSSQCADLSAPVGATSCSVFDMAVDFNGMAAEDKAAYYPRMQVSPGIPDAEMSSLFLQDGGTLHFSPPACGLPSSGTFGDYALVANEPSWASDTDQTAVITVQVDLESVSIPSGPFLPTGGLVLRYRNSQNYYAVELVNNGSALQQAFVRVANGQRTSLGTFDCPTGLGAAVRLAVAMKGTSYTVTCGLLTNSAPSAWVFTDALLPAEGSAGLFARDGPIEFDNFRVTRTCGDASSCVGVREAGTCTFRCQAGYAAAVGTNEVRTCQLDGSWTGGDLVCIPQAPEFAQAVWQFDVDEGAAVGSLVGTVTASAPAGMSVIYEIVPNASYPSIPFSVDSCGGGIRVALANLDVDDFASYTFELKALSNGNAASAATTSVQVVVNRVNRPPAILDPGTLSVSELAEDGALVATLQASDDGVVDAPDMTWVIAFGNSAGAFALNATSGELTVADGALLNFEGTRQYSLYVSATDPGGLVGYGTIRIDVTDENEPPTVSQGEVVAIHELDLAALPAGGVVGQADASDPDGDVISFAPLNDIRVAGTDGNFEVLPARTPLAPEAGVFGVRPSTGEITRLSELQWPPEPSDTELPFAWVEPLSGKTIVVRAVYNVTYTVYSYATAPVDGFTYVAVVSDIVVKGVPTVSGLAICKESLPVCMEGLPASNPQTLDTDPAGGLNLRVTGANFRSTQMFYVSLSSPTMPGVFFNTTPCEVEPINGTVAVCEAPPGMGSNLLATIVHGDPLGPVLQPTLYVSYTPPYITNVCLGTGTYCSSPYRTLYTTGGQRIQVRGTNLGWVGMGDDFARQHIRITYGPTNDRLYYNCDLVNVISTELLCDTNPGVGSSHRWVVRVADQRSPDSSLTSAYATPQARGAYFLTSNPQGGLSTAGGSPFLVFGDNFGPRRDAQGRTHSIVVTYGTQSPGVSTGVPSPGTNQYLTAVGCYITGSGVLCRTAPGVGTFQAFRVVVGQSDILGDPGVTTTLYLSMPVNYAAPVITGIEGAGANSADTAGGQTITLLGDNFGTAALNAIEWVRYAKPYQLEPGYIPRSGDEPVYTAANCAVVGAGSATSVQCTTVPGRGFGHAWSLRIGGQTAVAMLKANTSYGSPVIESFSGAGAAGADTRGQQAVQLHGRNFGPQVDDQVRVTYSVSVTQTDPDTGEALPTKVVTYVPDIGDCSMPAGEAHYTIECLTLPAAGRGVDWNVVVAGLRSESPTTSYAAPRIDSLQLYRGNATAGGELLDPNDFYLGDDLEPMPAGAGADTDGGQYVDVIGDYFGPAVQPGGTDLLQWVRFGKGSHVYDLKAGTQYQRLSDAVIRVKLPPGVGQGMTFAVSVADQESEPTSAPAAVLSYAPPVVEAVVPATGPTDQSGDTTTIVTVLGRNFGLLDPNAEVAVWFGNPTDGSELENLDAFGLSPARPGDDATLPYPTGYLPGGQHSLQFILPSGLGLARAVRVQVQPAGLPSLAVLSSVGAADPPATAPVNASDAFSYLDPTLRSVVVDPIRTAAELNNASVWFGPSASSARILRIYGTNFGPPASLHGDNVLRTVQFMGSSGWEAAGSDVHITTWTHTGIELYTLQTSGTLRVQIVSKSWDSQDTVDYEQVTRGVSFNDISPSLSAITAGASGFPTIGWAAEDPVFLKLKVMSIGKAYTLAISVGGASCPIVSYLDPTQVVAPSPSRPAPDTYSPMQEQVICPQVSDCKDQSDVPVNFAWDVWCRLPAGPAPDTLGEDTLVVLLRDNDLRSNEFTISYNKPQIREVRVWDGTYGQPMPDPDGASPSSVYRVLPDTGAVLVARDPAAAVAGPAWPAAPAADWDLATDVFSPTVGSVVDILGTDLGKCPVVEVGLLPLGRIPIADDSVCHTGTSPYRILASGSIHRRIRIRVPSGEGDGTDPGFLGVGHFALDILTSGQRNSIPPEGATGGADDPPGVGRLALPFSYTPPSVTGVVVADPADAGQYTGTSVGPTRGGVTLIIQGHNFGQPAGNYLPGSEPSLRVSIGRSGARGVDPSGPGFRDCLNVQRVTVVSDDDGGPVQYNHDRLTCVLPEGSGADLDVNVTVASVAGPAGLSVFSYAVPEVTALQVNSSAVNGSTVDIPAGTTWAGRDGPWSYLSAPPAGFYNLTIRGDNFGALDLDNHCAFFSWPNRPGASVQAARLSCDGRESSHGEGEVFGGYIHSWTHDQIELLVPPGVGIRDVTVRVRGSGPAARDPLVRLQGVSAPIEGQLLIYTPPTLARLHKVSGRVSTEGSDIVELVGSDFGRRAITSADQLTLVDALYVWPGGGQGLELPLFAADGASGYLDRSPYDGRALPTAALMVEYWRTCISETRDVQDAYVLDGRRAAVDNDEGFPFGACVEASAHTGKLSGLPPSVTTDILDQTDDALQFVSAGGLGTDRHMRLSYVEVDYNSLDPATSWLRLSAPAPLLFDYDSPVVTATTPTIVNMRELTATYDVKVDGLNFGPLGGVDNWLPSEREVSVTIGTQPCTRASRTIVTERSGAQYAAVQCVMDTETVGFKNMSLRVAGQTGFLEADDPQALYVACATDYFGQDDQLCLPCPEGAECRGFAGIPGLATHPMPEPQPGWYNLNSSDSLDEGMLAACPAGMQVVGPEHPLAPPSPRDVCVVPCKPAYACAGNNFCTLGYTSSAPNFRCSACSDRFYRRSGDCVRCPNSSWVLLVALLLLAACAGLIGWWLNRSKINIALLAIGVDYFQVLAIFADADITWPKAVKELFLLMSAFNLNIEIVAPECTIPELSFVAKWFFVQLVPLVVVLFALLAFLATKLYDIIFKVNRTKDKNIWSPLIAASVVIMYFLYLYITSTILSVWNCVPTNPPDGNLYLQSVFEECGKPGGIQMTLLPWSIIFFVVYVLGFPAAAGYVIYKHADTMRIDQLLRAMGLGKYLDTKDPLRIQSAFHFRNRYQRLYYHFRPDYYYWILILLARKFFISACALMFNETIVFQLAAVLLVLFISYTLQVAYQPYMAPQNYDKVLLDWSDLATKGAVAASREAAERAAGDDAMHEIQQNALAVRRTKSRKGQQEASIVDNGKHYELWNIVKPMLLKRQRRGRGMVNAMRQESSRRVSATELLGVLTMSLFDYNTVESVLLSAAILVSLGGVMYVSADVESKIYSASRDAVTAGLMVIIIASTIYFLVVLFVELYMLVTEEQRRDALSRSKAKKGSREAGAPEDEEARKAAVEAEAVSLEYNPVSAVTKISEMGNVAEGELDYIVNQTDPPDEMTWHNLRGQLAEFHQRFKDLTADNRRLQAAHAKGTVLDSSLRGGRSKAVRKQFGSMRAPLSAHEDRGRSRAPAASAAAAAKPAGSSVEMSSRSRSRRGRRFSRHHRARGPGRQPGSPRLNPLAAAAAEAGEEEEEAAVASPMAAPATAADAEVEALVAGGSSGEEAEE